MGRIKDLLEKQIVIELEGDKYQLDRGKGIDALVNYHFDNPDMGDENDFKDDKARMAYLKKQFKGLDVATIIRDIKLWVDEGEMRVKDLIKNKVIRKI